MRVRITQDALENKILAVNERLAKIEVRTNDLDTIKESFWSVQDSIGNVIEQSDNFNNRLDELEDRSRRNNLIFYGIADAKEAWQETEEKIFNIFREHLDPLIDHSLIDRAHRLGGPYREQKCWLVIVKFANFKIREKLFSQRAKLKDCNISVAEDFSPGTRHTRKKLLAFGKALPQSPEFRLRYTKLSVGSTTYVYDRQSDRQRAGGSPQHRAYVFSLKGTRVLVQGRHLILGHVSISR